MRRLALILVLAAAALAVAFAGPASAAVVDPTATSVSCSPSSVTTGTATSCTVTVTDTAASPAGVPSGTVSITTSPSTGQPQPCTLQGGAAGAVSAGCSVNVTPGAGGSYAVRAAYPGDTTHDASSGAGSLDAVDATQTSLSCSPSTVSLGQSTSCTATLTDATSPRAPTGQVTFTSSAPGDSTFTHAGICTWHPSAPGGSATCTATFTPGSATGYTVSATYSGDNFHSGSSGSTTVTATTTPAGGGPGSHPGSPGSVTIPVTTGPPPRGTLSIAKRAKVSHGRAALGLSCAGAAGSSCRGALVLVAHVKKRVKVPVKRTKRGRHHHRRQRPRFKTKVVALTVGSVSYTVAAGRAQTFSVKLSGKSAKLVTRAGKRGLHTTAIGISPVRGKVTLVSAHPKKHKHKHKHRKGHKGHHRRHKKG